MGGSTLGGGKTTPGKSPAAGRTVGQPAEKGVTSKPEAQGKDSGKAQESKLDTSKKKGKGGKVIPREKNEPGSKTGGEEAGT
jgi:hypothetical protein